MVYWFVNIRNCSTAKMNYRNAKLRWSLGCLRIGIIGIMLLGQVTKGQFEVPAQGLLCISECTSCPVICSPPPSHSSPAPPTPSYSPPVIYYNSPPPPSTRVHQPPPPPPLSPPPSSSSSESTPPPPSPNYQTIPSVSTPPLPTASMRNYTYPYYYFYASSAASLSFLASFSPLLLVLLVSPPLFVFWG